MISINTESTAVAKRTEERMEQIDRLVDRIERLALSAESKSAEGLQLVKEIETRDQLLCELRADGQELSSRLALQERELALLLEQQAHIKVQLQTTEQKLKNADTLLQAKISEAVALSDQAADLRTKLASKQAEFLKFSNWSSAIERAPLRYFIRKQLFKWSRSIYAHLPLPLAHKSRLARSIQRWLKKTRTATSAEPTSLLNISMMPSTSPKIEAGVQSSAAQPTVLMFGVIDWHFRIQRPQNLAKELAKAGQRTFYISNNFLDDDAPGFEVEDLDEASGLFQIRLKVSGAPAIYYAPPSTAAISQLCQSLALLMQWANVDAVHCIVQHAYWFPIARRIPNSTLIYDCMDHHEGFGNVAQELLDLEMALMRRADLLVATSDWIEQHGKRENRNVAVIRNAGEYNFFSQRPENIYQDPENRKIIGYYGAIAEWFDLDLLEQIAKSFPQHLILLIGNDTVNARKYLKACPNILMEGEVPYSSLPHYLYAMDVCLLPFKVIPLTLATNPVKVYEYLSAGKPVVSVKLPELSQFGELVKTAENHADFVAAVDEFLKDLPEPAVALQARQLFAKGQTWQHRAASLRQSLDTLPMPKISVVVLTYNNLELTKACLDSLVTRSNYANLEIVVVDNNSSDDTPAFLNAWAEGHSNRIIILNHDNKGFAAGNNLGLEAASGDYLVILNNDTVVTDRKSVV